MVDRDRCWSTEEMRQALDDDDDIEISHEKLTMMFHELEAAGVAEHVGTDDDGDDLWKLKSPHAAARFIAEYKMRSRLRSYKDSFLGGGD